MKWSDRIESTRKIVLRGIFRTKEDTDKSTQAYWNARWFLGLQHDKVSPELRALMVSKVENAMWRHGCETVLEVGCGAYAPLKGVQGVTHLDYSRKALQKSGLEAYIYADITRRIPVPDRTFDAAYCSNLLIHIRNVDLGAACHEIARVTRKIIILNESDKRDLEQYFGGLKVERV